MVKIFFFLRKKNNFDFVVFVCLLNICSLSSLLGKESDFLELSFLSLFKSESLLLSFNVVSVRVGLGGSFLSVRVGSDFGVEGRVEFFE